MNILKSINQSINAGIDYMVKIRTVAELSELSDRQLDDIGLTRAELKVKVLGVMADKATTPTPAIQKPVVVKKSKRAVAQRGFDFGTLVVSLYRDQKRSGGLVV